MLIRGSGRNWWAQKDSNLRPAYSPCRDASALTVSEQAANPGDSCIERDWPIIKALQDELAGEPGSALPEANGSH